MNSFALFSLPNDVFQLVIDHIDDWRTLHALSIHALFNTCTFFRITLECCPRRFIRYWNVYNYVTAPILAVAPSLARRNKIDDAIASFGPSPSEAARRMGVVLKRTPHNPFRTWILSPWYQPVSTHPYDPLDLVVGNPFYKHEDCGLCGTAKPRRKMSQEEVQPARDRTTSLPSLPNGTPLYSLRYISSHLPPVARELFRQLLQGM